MDARTLSFATNGVSHGVAFENLPAEGVYPAMDIYGRMLQWSTVRVVFIACAMRARAHRSPSARGRSHAFASNMIIFAEATTI